MRGRNRNNSNKGPNPLTRSYESNGPDVKIRGTAQHVADKYAQLARDAQSSGDPVAAENYFQHAEHYYRIIAAAQEQYRQQYGAPQRNGFDDEEDGDDEAMNGGFNGQPAYGQDFGGGDDYEGAQPHRGQPYEHRQDRGERQDGRPNRFNDRFERRGDRFQNRDRQGQPGGNRQEGPRQEGPRQDYPRQDYARQENPRQENPRQDALRFEGGQGEGYRGAPAGGESHNPPRRERRREEVQPETEDAGGLPAFLTAPVRSAPPAPEPGEPDVAASEAPGGFPARPRRRRRPRFEGAEGAAPSTDLLATDPPSAE